MENTKHEDMFNLVGHFEFNETEENVKYLFDSGADYANAFSTCKKVSVGAIFISPYTKKIYHSANVGSFNCKQQKICYKAYATGIYESCEETRKYCKAIHAEINMISKLKKCRLSKSAIESGILFVTRYPCENCALECAKFGFKHIYYCGREEISQKVKDIFESNGIEYKWFKDYDFEFK